MVTKNLSKSQSLDINNATNANSDKPAEYSSPGHTKKIQDFKNKSKTTLGKSVDSFSSQWKEANLQGMTSKELVDHLEGLRNTVKRLQNTEFKFKTVDEEEVSCG